MDALKPKLKTFIIEMLFKKLWVIILVILLTNIFFKPIINTITIPLIIATLYSVWLDRKNKYLQKIFINEALPTGDTGLLWFISGVEFLILVVGLHFLFKGFSTVTGVSENLFSLDRLSFSLSVSFILALAIVIGMLIILYKIKHTSKNKKLILTYILVDIFILFPYNFIFSYENCVKDNLTHYYANAMPALYDKLTKELATKKGVAEDLLRPVANRNIRLNNQIEVLEQSAIVEQQNYSRLDFSEMQPEARISAIRQHNLRVRGINSEIQRKKGNVSDRVDDLSSTSAKYKTLDSTLKTLDTAIKGILGNKIEKEKLASEVLEAKKKFIMICQADTTLLNDKASLTQMDKLQVIAESPTDGFFNLLKDLFSWALKDEYTKHINTNMNGQTKITEAQFEWNGLAPQKRWFSFLFAILIDVFPLVISLSYIYYIKNKRHKTS